MRKLGVNLTCDSNFAGKDSMKTLHELAAGYPVVTITGPRQSVKTTLSQAAFRDKPFVSLAGRAGLLHLLPFSVAELQSAGLDLPDLPGLLFKGLYPPSTIAH